MVEFRPIDRTGAQWDRRRFAVGIAVSSGCREVSAVLVVGEGLAFAIRPQIAAHAIVSAPPEVTDLYDALSAGHGTHPAQAGVLAAHLAEVQASAVERLAADAAQVWDRVLIAGVADPGLWDLDHEGPPGYLGLCDAPRLADRTGLNVVDAFPARDLAQGGRGGPIDALAQWLLLHHAEKTRVLFDLARTVRLVYLPASRDGNGIRRTLAFDIGPGTDLLDPFARRLTGGTSTYDAGGRLAVQGRLIPQLLEHWLEELPSVALGPNWHPQGISADSMLADALQLAIQFKWSIRDVLCTATHLIAETVARHVTTRLPHSPTIDEIVLIGGGQHNGMLIREIGSRLPTVRLIRETSLQLPEKSIEPAAYALLALLYIDQTPANPTAVTGARVPRVLGRLTSGSPQNWNRFLREIAANRPAVTPLRAAI